MSLSVTQCPACESTFNITARILESAGGKVRCGACLTVFEAPENIIEYGDDSHDGEESVFVGSDPGNYFDPSTFLTRQSLQEAALSETDEESRLTLESTSTDSARDEEADFLDAVAANTPEAEVAETTKHEDVSPANTEERTTPDIATNEQDSELADQEEQGGQEEQAIEQTIPPEETSEIPAEVDSEQQAPVSSPASYSPYSPYAHYGAPEQEPTPEDFRLHASFSVQPSPYSSSRQADPAQPLPGENSQQESASDEHASEAAPDEAFLDAVNESLTGSEHDLPESPLDWTLTASDEPGAEPEPIEDLGQAEDTDTDLTAQAADEEIEELGEPEEEGEQLDLEDEEDEEDEEKAAEDVDQSVEAIRARALQAQLKDDEALEELPSENLQALGKFSTPVEILAGKPRSLRRQLTWAAVALLGGVLLGAQYLWQETDRFSQNIQLRPLYETACQWLGCELPVYSDIEAIRANNLAVRSHPDVDNALAVNIEFQNSSPFAQQFPVLILSFNAANNSVIALREFAASEYLPQQLRNRRLMPARTPIQLDLSIIDPGSDAVNYTLAFRRP